MSLTQINAPRLVVRMLKGRYLIELHMTENQVNKELSEFQIVNILNYINQAWGNDYGRISVEDTRRWLAE